MARETATSMDVARHAGVSQSAVSRVFTPGASVSREMVDRVRASAEELGYRPNILARSMITGRSRLIGLVVAYLDNQFYPEILEKLSTRLQEQGYHVLVFMAQQTAGNIDAVLQEILDYQVDGIVLASVGISSPLAERCDAAGIPVVLFNRGQKDNRFSTITSDNFGGGRALADFLIAGGHERIAYIAGWEGASTQRDREAGFLAGLAAHGRDLFARGVGNFQSEVAAAAAVEMFSDAERPDAVFVANDHMAFAVMDVLRHRLGLRVPEDVSVVGFDDVQLAAWPSFNLTTIRQPSGRMVEATVAALIDKIEGGDRAPRQVRVDARLIVRGSARRPATHAATQEKE
ncbi:MAG: LacI family DNA-binding transcriptional regulator [Pseudomonadota bacterium]|nr:LacI family DNA-binding transcriptional regulator [Pseudomonadota bacterium]